MQKVIRKISKSTMPREMVISKNMKEVLACTEGTHVDLQSSHRYLLFDLEFHFHQEHRVHPMWKRRIEFLFVTVLGQILTPTPGDGRFRATPGPAAGELAPGELAPLPLAPWFVRCLQRVVQVFKHPGGHLD
ncbi:uncharacterized protein LOC118555280 [Halichoerus grypus]